MSEEDGTQVISIPGDVKGKRRFWEEEVERWRASGESRRVYSQRRGVSHQQLNYWSYKLLSPVKGSREVGKLLPVTLGSVAEREVIRIKRREGVVIELPLLKDRDYLRSLLEMLLC